MVKISRLFAMDWEAQELSKMMSLQQNSFISGPTSSNVKGRIVQKVYTVYACSFDSITDTLKVPDHDRSPE